MTGRFSLWFAAMAAAIWLGVGPGMAQADGWTVAKASGEAWIGSGAQPASVTQQTQLRPGDSVKTGRNGRVLLVRGQETILVSPNSAISLPEAGRPGLSTVIQQAGSILLDVEKRNVQHFEVETPFLAAVVKGTRFRVSITGGTAKVDVVRGQVQVTDFRSGDRALVNPQQFARSSAATAAGLRLGGAGQLAPVTPGTPQTPRVEPLRVPAGGLRPAADAAPLPQAQPTTQASAAPTQPAVQRTAGGGMRIVAPIGEMKLDIGKLTNGLARNDAQASSKDNGKAKDWAARLQPGNGDTGASTGNSGAAPAAAAAGPASVQQSASDLSPASAVAAVGPVAAPISASPAGKPTAKPGIAGGAAKPGGQPSSDASAGPQGSSNRPGQQGDDNGRGPKDRDNGKGSRAEDDRQGPAGQAGRSVGQLLQTVYGIVSGPASRHGKR